MKTTPPRRGRFFFVALTEHHGLTGAARGARTDSHETTVDSGILNNMPRCDLTDTCVFFNDEVGYSIDLQATMRIEYCLGNFETCARYQAYQVIARSDIPDDLIPTDHSRSAELIAEKRPR